MLLSLSGMGSHEKQLCEALIRWGVIAAVAQDNDSFISSGQLSTYKSLRASLGSSSDPLQLFPSEHELLLSRLTGLLLTSQTGRDVPGGEVLTQLLLRIVQQNSTNQHPTSLGRVTLPGQATDVLTKDARVLRALEDQIARFSQLSLQRDGTNTLARSANYMGAKTQLCPAISAILESYLPADGVVLDLMCGSGAASGAFAQRWQVYASDAQAFSRNLALIQGGGMTIRRAKSLVTEIVDLAKSTYARVAELVRRDIEIEEGFLMSELSDAGAEEFALWAVNYPRVNTQRFLANKKLVEEIELHRMYPSTHVPTLFTRYYANLFFGVRQSAEIDSLRRAIDNIESLHERNWALGALICAVSACADNYGGHFAQPRFDSSSPEKLHGKIRETIARRTMSITQEFSARLINLATESERTIHVVEPIEGPWKHCLEKAKPLLAGRAAAVYLDPPYTRDEYSRYYHILETLVRYDYPVVSGKASIPAKGDGGRFASEFFTRSSLSVEDTITEIISTCLDNQWSCLWSYSSSGVARIESIVARLEPLVGAVDIYKAKYTYKPQGRRNATDKKFQDELPLQSELVGFPSLPSARRIAAGSLPRVDEYMIMIRPKGGRQM